MDTSAPAVAADHFAAAFIRACELDVEVRKPGNVSRASPGHGMQADQFIDSARAAAPALARAGARVGVRLEAAVQASFAAAGCNTNLGIVLLAAPVALALDDLSVTPTTETLRVALSAVMRGLDVDDAMGAYRAIATAQPAGLGRVESADVREPPRLSLLAAMRLAADRDSIARQYAQDHADLFEVGVVALEAAERGRGRRDATAAVQRIYLEFLGRWPDSHIVRKHGEAMAHSVLEQALPWRARARAGEDLDQDPAFAAWDADLKARGLNPGTSADLTVASLLIAGLLQRDRPGLVSRH